MGKRVIGIQGGRGSYNELAISKYLQSLEPHRKIEADIRYLYSTQNVFEALKSDRVDWGQFAVGNSVGGYVTESLEAVAEFLSAENGIDVIGSYELPITHCLMAHSSSRLEDIKRIISHPQVFKQCKNSLQAKYKRLELIEGVGDYSDPAKVASGIANGDFGFDTATLSNPLMAETYGLQLLSDALQDSDQNKTRFLLVKKV